MVMANESQQESMQHVQRNGRAAQVNWFYTASQHEEEQDIPDTEDGSISHALGSLIVETKHVLPLLLGAILAGAVFGFFWKRK
jgi:hypothetical protein